jgi:hypothetical protein
MGPQRRRQHVDLIRAISRSSQQAFHSSDEGRRREVERPCQFEERSERCLMSAALHLADKTPVNARTPAELTLRNTSCGTRLPEHTSEGRDDSVWFDERSP